MPEPIGPADLIPLLAQVNLTPADCSVLESRIRPGGRPLLRLGGPGGQMLKVRSFPTSDAAAAMVQLRCLIGKHPGFARVQACRGPYVLEEWVEGAVLAGREISPVQAQACGALLAELHLTALPANGQSRPQGSDLAAKSSARLHELAAAGALTTFESTRLAEGLLAKVPAHVRQGLIHFDFCGENLVWSEERGPVSIDNERLRIGPLAYDLGRTMALWPLPDEALEALIAGYVAAGGPAETDDCAFWRLLGLITSAWFRVRHDPTSAERPLRLLRAWAAGHVHR